jgi:outer membrane protein OmpA-like peptidoglycan-associated protein
MTRLYSRMLTTTFLLFITLFSFAQHHYLIVGAFAVESNAQKFTGYVRSKHYDGNYESYVAKNLFYVYVLKTANHDEAINLAKHLQAESEFKDCWVFKGTLGNESEVNQLLSELVPVPKKDSATTLQTPIDSTTTLATIPTIDSAALQPQIVSITDSISTITKETVVETDPKSIFPTDSANIMEEPPMKVRGKLFRFAIQLPDGKPLHGEVHHVDYGHGRDLATYKGNQYIDVLNPMKNNPMSIVCGIFGYKEVVHEIDYTDPASLDFVTKDDKGAWIIPFQLERMKKGDISVMYHVSFYKDAVVMLPVSKSELDELVNMMTDNPNYKIKIHGHCNGSNARRIIALGESKNYFDVKGSREVKGSAKELSKLRAEAVQTYLADHGIDRSRSEIYPWGALNMLVDEHSTSAKLNDRIEVEIMAD